MVDYAAARATKNHVSKSNENRAYLAGEEDICHAYMA